MTDISHNKLLSRKISDFCRLRVDPVLPPQESARIKSFLLNLIGLSRMPPRSPRGYDWDEIAFQCGLGKEALQAAKTAIVPALDAIARNTKSPTRRSAEISGGTATESPTPRGRSSLQPTAKPIAARPNRSIDRPEKQTATPRQKPGIKPREIEEFPEALFKEWSDPASFPEALELHMRRHGDSYWHLHRAVVRDDENFDDSTIRHWLQGSKAPRSVASMEVLARIERRYRLPAGYFKTKLPHQTRSASGHILDDIGAAERRRIAWHLPDDFNARSRDEQEEILKWVQRVIIRGSTDYRRFQAAAMKQRYAIRFPGITYGQSDLANDDCRDQREEHDHDGPSFTDPDLMSGVIDAPPALAMEMVELIRFKTATLTAFGLQRNGVWGEETTSQKIEHLGLMFGALAAHPRGPVRGYGVPLQHLTFALFVFPSVWDWYVQWREKRRGFYTAWEVDMLRISLALTRKETGWLRQHPHLASRLRPIDGLVSQKDIDRARADWDDACDVYFKHASSRVKEIQRVARVHRDPFEPIMPVLEAESPVGEYRKITEEILRLMPDERLYRRPAAEAARSFLMLRFGLHLGLRQKNLRQLMVCERGKPSRSERQLADMKRGELRWSDRDQGWEVLIPSVAFKNAHSSYFGSKPFRLVLPNLGGLYDHIEAYIDRHRRALLGEMEDPGTFFIKTVKTTSADASYDQNTFYEAWRLTIQRYGIFNPYTGRGAIPGLLPHGPHNVRDVLATHILKQTGSYEQASYAIQDTPDMVAHHYGRFLPQDKAALAARILNQVWEAA
ncbi:MULTISPECIES: hypothetical protein [unclassified Mesorhizobium]|uniref:hypothetical protein n=1 Tax=unclassified Mesorhizobium TaxID=325217 RepID=UPI001126C3B2|nr:MULTISPECIES: hypothetical protein [unclassified Mesorhizobium]MBZ9894420.1 hypothetical protein [Mesorhizobium sp. BR1-1-6]TPM57626.1 hypothetical protein FJ959_12645 [Mesorhizobium sp. B2-2-4]TPM65571.1 hypothetical protein FJ965_15190 [Mesorhizobium sp. B2-2-1]TPN38519.1 hypothetical protein FJ979_14430 [Mesorhizobium sp. B1-1-6]TPN71897.1 hypothetical protein FJ984_03170 [Mesorhizobium sp. B1-1-3]